MKVLGCEEVSNQLFHQSIRYFVPRISFSFLTFSILIFSSVHHLKMPFTLLISIVSFVTVLSLQTFVFLFHYFVFSAMSVLSSVTRVKMQPKCLQKLLKWMPQQFLQKVILFKTAQKVNIVFGLPLVSKFVAKNFQKLPNLVTLVSSTLL